MSINAKNFEKYFNDYMSKLIYAVFDDISRNWNGTLLSTSLFQNYENLMRDKKLQDEGLKSRFKITSEVRQHLTKMFVKMVEELGEIEISDIDDIHAVISKLSHEIPESLTAFMSVVADQYRDIFGQTLVRAGDPSRWLSNQLIGCMPNHSTKIVIFASLYDCFNNFLKTIAWKIGKLIWYTEGTVNSKLFLGILAQLDMDQNMIDEIANEVRPKPLSKKGKKTPSKGVPANTDAPADVPIPTASPSELTDDSVKTPADDSADAGEIAAFLVNV